MKVIILVLVLLSSFIHSIQSLGHRKAQLFRQTTRNLFPADVRVTSLSRSRLQRRQLHIYEQVQRIVRTSLAAIDGDGMDLYFDSEEDELQHSVSSSNSGSSNSAESTGRRDPLQIGSRERNQLDEIRRAATDREAIDYSKLKEDDPLFLDMPWPVERGPETAAFARHFQWKRSLSDAERTLL